MASHCFQCWSKHTCVPSEVPHCNANMLIFLSQNTPGIVCVLCNFYVCLILSYISPLTTILVDVSIQSLCNLHFIFMEPNSPLPGENLNINIDCHNYTQGYSFHVNVSSTCTHNRSSHKHTYIHTYI